MDFSKKTSLNTISPGHEKTRSIRQRQKICPALLFWVLPLICSFLNPDTACAQKPALEPVTIQLRWFHQFQFAGYYAAIEKGFYADEGLHVSLREFESGQDRIAPVLEGNAHYGVGGPSLLKMRAEGDPVVVLAQIFQHSPAVLITRRGSGILSPYELVGKKVMFPLDDIGSAPIQAMLLETLGDMQRITVVPHTYDNLDLINGKVDALATYISNEPFKLKNKGVDVDIIDPRSYGIDFYGDNLFTTDNEIAAHPERVEKIIRATQKGWAYALEHKEEIIELILTKYNPDADHDLLRFEAKIIDQMIVPDLVEIGEINPRRYERIAETYHRLGMSSASTIPDGFTYRKQPEPIVLLSSEERSWLKAHPDIQIGYTDAFEPEVIVDPGGTYRGIQVDILDELNRRLGTRIRLTIHPVPELLEKARKKEVDGILSLHPDFADRLGLSKTRPHFSGYPALFTRMGVSFDDPSDFAGKKVAVVDKVFFSEKIMDRYGKRATILKVQDAMEGLRSIISGQADVFLGATLNAYLITKYQLFGLKTQYVFYDRRIDNVIGVRTDWPIFLSILNKGLSSFSHEEIEAIVAKWSHINEKQGDLISFTPEEQAWLAKAYPVRVRVTEQAPHMFTESGRPLGIAPDLLKEVSKKTGIKFQFINPSPPFSVDLKGIIRHRGPDLLGSLTPTLEREGKILFTRPYITSPKFIFTRDDAEFVASMEHLNGKTVAVIRGYLVHKELAEDYPGIKFLFFKSNREALTAVSSGEAFAFIGGLTSTPVMINQFGLKNLKAAAPSRLKDATVAMAIRSDWPELRSIINKVYEAIPESERAAIVNKWSSFRVEYGVRPGDILKRTLLVGGSAFGVLLLFVFWNWSLRRQVHLRTAELDSSIQSLRAEIAERKQAVEEVKQYQQRLKALASQLTLSEEEERRHIAADLHDLIGHSLALARIQLATLSRASSKTEIAVLVADVSNILLKAIQDTKNLMFELSSPSLNEIGLGAAISEYLDDYLDRRYGLETKLIDEIDGRLRKKLDENVRAILFRNARELLTNVVKHAKAKKVSVQLRSEGKRVTVMVEDDGVGFDPHAAFQSKEAKGGFGLFNIHERMADLGGTFEIFSEPGKGCRAMISVPFESSGEKSE